MDSIGPDATPQASPDATPARDKEFMTTLAKGLAVLRSFGVERPQMTLADAAAATGTSRATARRILKTLAELGYVTQSGRRFALAPRVLELGFGYLSTKSWIDSAGDLLKELSETVDETCSIATLQGAEVVFVAQAAVQRIVSMSTSVGARLPAFHTAAGRIQLGYLPHDELWARLRRLRIEYYTPSTITDLAALARRIADDRAQGFSIVDEELERGLRALAVPLVSRKGDPVAALNVSVSANRTTRESLRQTLLPHLRASADKITLLLG